MGNRPKKQHYIPQFLLRNFRIPGEELLWVFDKRSSNIYKSAVRDVASERYYNDAKLGKGNYVSFESRFSKIEKDAAPILTTLVEAEDISGMTEHEQAAITVFLIAQMVRGKAWRSSMSQAFEVLSEKLGGKENALRVGVPASNEEDEKLALLLDLPKTINEFAPALINKLWMLQKTPKRQHLWIGDEPIVRQNSTPSRVGFGNTGLACPGVEIYLPLSPHLILSLLCPTLGRMVEVHSKFSSSTLAVLNAERLLAAMKTGKPYLLAQPEITRLNALQVVHSERIIISSHPDFSQVEKMIRDNPSLRHIPRYVS